jgi:alpha-1,6-mannosyltransferase
LAPVGTGPKPTTEERVGEDQRYLLLAGILLLIAVAFAIRQPFSADLGVHAGTVERLRVSLTDPGDPLVDADIPSPYYSPYSLLLGLLARLFGLSGLAALAIAGPVVLGLLLWGLRAFVHTLTDRPLAPALALVFVLLLWGVKARLWSGFFSLWALPFVLAFPSTVALALTLSLWAGLARTLDAAGPAGRRPALGWLGLGLLAATVALVHPFTTVMAGLGALALVVDRARRLPVAAWLGLALATVVAGVLVALWPYYSFVGLFRASADLDVVHRSLYHQPWLYYGLIVVALPALWLRWRRDRLDPLVLLFVSATVVVALGWLTGRYALGRVWPAVLLSGQLALGVELAAPLPRRLARIWLPVTALACLAGVATQAGNLLYLAPHSVITPRVRATARMFVDWPDYQWLAGYLRPGEVLLTDDYFAVRTVPAYGVRTIAPVWPDPFLPDTARRERDQATLVDPATDPATRAALLARYRVRWVLETPGGWTLPGDRTPVATGPRGQRLYRL